MTHVDQLGWGDGQGRGALLVGEMMDVVGTADLAVAH